MSTSGRIAAGFFGSFDFFWGFYGGFGVRERAV
jgi:hypothetical protein